MFKGLTARRAPKPRRLREGLPLSPNEERYLLAEEMTGQVYIAPTATRILGPIELSGIEDAIRATCERHEARRTGFERGPDGTFTKYVEDQARVRIKTLSMPGASDEEIRDAVRAHLYAKTDYSPQNLNRYLLIDLGPDDHVLAYGFHHATSDGVTANAFAMEAFMRAMGFEITAPVAQYSDFWSHDWRNSDAYRQAEAFWKARMAGLEAGGQLPLDRRPSDEAAVRPGVTLPISAELAAATKTAAERIGVSHFNFFYAVYLVLLSRLTGAARVCTTFQSAGRRGLKGAETAHGVFSNKLILGAPVREAESIRALAARVRGEIRDAIEHEIFPYHHVIRATGVRPRFAINWYPPSTIDTTLAGLRFESIDLVENQDDDDLNVRFLTTPAGMAEVLFYNPRVVSEARARAIGEQLIALAGALAADVDQPIGEVRLADLAPAPRLPDPTEDLPPPGRSPVFAAVLERAKARPDAVAVEFADERLTYAELERASRAVAQDLRALALAPGERVAILAHRSPRLVVAMLGALRAGAVFTVLDADQPEPYLAELAAIAAPRAILHGEAALAGLAARLAEPLRAATIAVREDAPGVEPGADGLDQARAGDPAYILFTSGSTGRPKGVACAHAPLTDFLAWQARTFGFTVDDRFSLASGLAHDPMLRDVFGPLCIGARLVIPSQSLQAPGRLAAWLRAARITVAHLTPSLGQLLAAGSPDGLPDLRRLFWGGEPLRPALAAAIGRLAPAAEQVNFYGSTETPQAAGVFRLDGDPDWQTVPLGHGVEGVQLLVVDPEGRTLAVGEPGEIAVRSRRRCLGYVDRGRLTLPDGAPSDPAAVALYRTGDRGFYLPDGAVMFLGRTDDQLKVRGHRVELAEVTAALAARPGVRQAAAVALAGEAGQPRVIGFVAASPSLDPDALRSSLQARLPAHLVPHEIRRLDALPLTANGKVDRQALAVHAEETPERPAAPAANEVEQGLMDAWSSLLGVKAISRESTFAGLGGDSLSYVQAFLALEEAIGEPPEDWPQMTIAALAAGAARAPGGLRTTVDPPILLRAVSIFLVVSGHFGLFRYGGGATTSLFVVSGYLFGALQLPKVFAERSARPAIRWLVRLLVPTMLFSLALFSVKALAGKHPNLSTLALTADFQDYSKLSGPAWGGHEFYLWFIHCLVQMLAAVCLALVLTGRLNRFRISPMRFVAGFFTLACVARFVAPAFLYPGFLAGHMAPLAPPALSPTTHLATFLLGMMVAVARGRSQKLTVAAIAAAYALASATSFGPQQALIALVSAGALLGAAQLPLPRAAAMGVLAISASSLFIYLTQFLTLDALRIVRAPQWPLLEVAAAVAVGVAAAKAWAWTSALVRRAVDAAAPPVEQPAI